MVTMQPLLTDSFLQLDVSHYPFTPLPTEDPIIWWLENTTTRTMASLADDSSVDDNVSSIGDSTWDMIDEGSARSEDEDQPLQPRTSLAEVIGNELPMMSSASTAKRANTSLHGDIRLGYDEVPTDTSSDSEEIGSTTSPKYAAPKSNQTESRVPVKLQDLQELNLKTPHLCEDTLPPHKLKFEVPNNSASDHTTVQVSKVMPLPRRLQSSVFHVDEVNTEPLMWKIKQQMSTSNLNLDKPYRVMYLGPPEVKQRIMHKIGSALFESVPQTTGTSDMESSRVTVVPLSAFGPDREVALLASVGLDISIEEWTSDSPMRDRLGKGPLKVLVNNRQSVRSNWNPRNSRFELSDGYNLPDLAIIFIPTKSATKESESRFVIHSFLRRHAVPTLNIISSMDWQTSMSRDSIDVRMPHFLVETTESHKIVTHMPIDLDTFLDIDALQMNRNLASLKPVTSAATMSSSASISLVFRGEVEKAYQFVKRHPWSVPPIKILAMALLLLVAAKYLIASNGAQLFSLDGLGTPFGAPVNRHPEVASMARKNAPTAATAPEIIPPPSIAKMDLASTKSKHSDLAALFPDSMLLPNKSEKFMVHVIGEGHVIMRSPRWFSASKKMPSLNFQLKRQHKSLDYEFSAPFDGVYVLKVPREDAHGLVAISVWTVKKPKVNETFQVDFGTPWLKSAGWQAAAQVVSEQVQEEFHSAHASLSRVFDHTREEVRTFIQDTAKAAESVIKEVEAVGSASLDQTFRTTDLMLARSKELSNRLTDAIHRHRLTSDPLARLKHAQIREDISTYTRHISKVLSEQAEALTQAATGLNVRALANEVQLYRERNLKETQVKALHMWWKVRGGPPPSRSLKREERRATRSRGKWSRK